MSQCRHTIYDTRGGALPPRDVASHQERSLCVHVLEWQESLDTFRMCLPGFSHDGPVGRRMRTGSGRDGPTSASLGPPRDGWGTSRVLIPSYADSGQGLAPEMCRMCAARPCADSAETCMSVRGFSRDPNLRAPATAASVRLLGEGECQGGGCCCRTRSARALHSIVRDRRRSLWCGAFAALLTLASIVPAVQGMQASYPRARRGGGCAWAWLRC